MKKDVIIKIVSTQTTEDGTDTGEMTVQGTVSYEEDRAVIEYSEANEEMGLEDMTVTVMYPDTVSIIRRGAFSSEMSIQQNVRHFTYYKTPYGEFTMGVYGKNVGWQSEDGKGALKMKYTLDFNNGYVSDNSMNIYIEEK